MGFNKFSKFRVFLAVLVLFMATVVKPVSAQEDPAAEPEHADMVATDTAQQINSTTGSIGDTPSAVISSDGSENDDESTLAAAEEVVDNSALYKSLYYYLLLFVLLCVFLGIIGKVLRVYELTREVQGKKAGINWNNIQRILFVLFLIAGLYGTYWSYDYWGYVAGGNSASVHGDRLDMMMAITVAITTFVFIITQILLFGFSYKYSAKENRKAYYYPHNNAIERLWTIIPALVLTALVVFGFFTWRSITNPPEEERNNALSIEVTGEQFKWNVRYAGADNKLGLRNYKLTTATNTLGIDFKDQKSWDDKLGPEIYLPVNRPVRITINSKDVLHSFYLPDFRVQMNAVPGMPTYFQFTPKFTTEEMREKLNDPKFNYTLLCAKICGAGHYNMQYRVTVVGEKEYEEWIAKQALFFNDDMKKELQAAQLQESSTNTLATNN